MRINGHGMRIFPMATLPMTKPSMTKPPKGNDQSWGKIGSYGLEVACGVGLGVWIGNWLDHRYGWAPWGLLIGSLVGLIGGMYLLIKDGLKANKR
jgi:F0F1-type ATP synthase assembly protein I